MNNKEKLQARLVEQQNRCIRQLEEQLAVYEEKDKAQELLIEKLNQALELLTEELSMAKTGKERQGYKEE